MELNSIESHMDKVVQYLEDLSKSDKKLYAKTRFRLGELNTQLCHSVELISQILTDNMLKQDVEFGENINELKEEADSINKDIVSTMDQVTHLNTFISENKPTTNGKGVMSTYRKILNAVAVEDIKNEHVKTCAQIISKWFDYRFSSSDKNFKYQMEMIPHWIADIIILYGYCIQQQNFNDIFTLDTWCNDIHEGTIHSPYAVPFCVHKIAHNMDKRFVTFSGLGLYDLLLDAGYKELDDSKLGNVVLSPYIVRDKFNSYCPDIVDDYTYCGDDESLLRKYKLIGG